MGTTNEMDAPFIDVQKCSLEEWLKLFLTPEDEDGRSFYLYPDFQFPTDQLRDEYLADIENRPPLEIRRVLRRFLITTGTLGSDRAGIPALISDN